jgi:DNA-binding SARP family transcriptional activator
LAGHGGNDLPAEPTFRLALLKGFELTRSGRAIPLSSGPQRLLAYLALNRRSLRRVHVAGVLWTDVPEDRAAGNLRSALWRLRLGGLDLVGAEGGSLTLSPQVMVDVQEAGRLAKFVLDPGADLSALGLDDLPFAGELLPGWCEDWVILERERQRQICLHLLEGLCQRWTKAGHYEQAVMAGLTAVAGEPLRESAHRALISAYLAEGNLVEAIRQYDYYRGILREELQLEPSALMNGLLNGVASNPA